MPSRNTPKGILICARGQWGRGTTVSFQPGLTLGVQVDRRQDIPKVPKWEREAEPEPLPSSAPCSYKARRRVTSQRCGHWEGLGSVKAQETPAPEAPGKGTNEKTDWGDTQRAKHNSNPRITRYDPKTKVPLWVGQGMTQSSGFTSMAPSLRVTPTEQSERHGFPEWLGRSPHILGPRQCHGLWGHSEPHLKSAQ